MSSSNASIGRSAGKLRYGEVRGEDGAPAHSHQQVRTLAYGIEMARGFHKPREYPQFFQVLQRHNAEASEPTAERTVNPAGTPRRA